MSHYERCLRGKIEAPPLGRGVDRLARHEFSLFPRHGRGDSCPPVGVLSYCDVIAVTVDSTRSRKDLVSTSKRVDSAGGVCIDRFVGEQFRGVARSDSFAWAGLFRARHPRVGDAHRRHILFYLCRVDESK